MEGVQGKASDICGEIEAIPFKCEQCGHLFCGDPGLPEIHDCSRSADQIKTKSLSEDVQGYDRNYSEPGFWHKINRYGKVAGASIVYHALLLWHVATKASTPLPVKLLIIGGLGYFIAPTDVIPDFLMGLGYGDDAALLMGIITSTVTHMDKESKSKASAKIKDVFGDDTNIVSPFS